MPAGLQAAGRKTFSRFATFPPRGALHGAVCTIRGCDLPRRAVPVLLVPAVGLTLSLPQRIGALRDLLVLLPIHGQFPHTSPIETNCAVGCRQTAPGLQPGPACRRHAGAPEEDESPSGGRSLCLPYGGQRIEVSNRACSAKGVGFPSSRELSKHPCFRGGLAAQRERDFGWHAALPGVCLGMVKDLRTEHHRRRPARLLRNRFPAKPIH